MPQEHHKSKPLALPAPVFAVFCCQVSVGPWKQPCRVLLTTQCGDCRTYCQDLELAVPWLTCIETSVLNLNVDWKWGDNEDLTTPRG